MDIGDLFKKRSGSPSGGTNPFLGQIILTLLLVGLAGAYVGLFWLPKSEQVKQNQAKVAEVGTLRQQLVQLKRDITQAEDQLSLAKETYESVTRLFHTDQELEDLYRRLSTLALQHGLMISKVTKGEEYPIYSGPPPKEGEPRKEPPLYYRIKVAFQIVGRYPAYMSFSRDLAGEGKIINIDSEKIETIRDEKSSGKINVELGLSTYRIAS